MRDVDTIVETVTRRFPAVEVEQLKVSHPGADDDGLWFFSLPGSSDEVQIESWNGMCPFLIETRRTPERRAGQSVQEVADVICDYLATVNFA
jgi:hypothetical protein